MIDTWGAKGVSFPLVMATKPAQEVYTREEVLEILEHNVGLYKNDPGFAEFIVQLTLYLVEASGPPPGLVPDRPPNPNNYNLKIQKGPSMAGATEPPTASHPRSSAHPGTPPGGFRQQRPVAPPPPRRPDGLRPPTTGHHGLGHPSRPSKPAPSYPGSMRSMDEIELPKPESLSRDTAPKPFVPKGVSENQEQDPTPKSSSNLMRPHIRPAAPPPSPIKATTPHPDVMEDSHKNPINPVGSRFSLERAPLQTPSPIPEHSPAKNKRDQGEASSSGQQKKQGGPGVGKTQVYRVVRPYKSQTSMEAPCHSCGTMYALESPYCPACGSPRTR